LSRSKNWPLALAALAAGLGMAAVFFLSRGERPGPPATGEEGGGGVPDYRRIICAAPSVTEMVFALGMGSRVVGVSDFSGYPPEARRIARIGGQINPNRERILTLEPDFVIYQGKHRVLSRFCREQGIAHLSVTIDRVADITASILRIGAVLGAEARARSLAAEIREQLEDLRRRTGALPPRHVFLGLGHTPGDLTGLMTTGSGTFLNELIEMAGGINIFSDAPGKYPRISKEALVRRRPDIIIEILAEGLSPENRVLLKADWKRLSSLPAVSEDRIHFLNEDYLLIPGVRVARTARRLAAVIHPEIFEAGHD
jgi:iron complex transport system substrate-binding protein